MKALRGLFASHFSALHSPPAGGHSSCSSASCCTEHQSIQLIIFQFVLPLQQCLCASCFSPPHEQVGIDRVCAGSVKNNCLNRQCDEIHNVELRSHDSHEMMTLLLTCSFCPLAVLRPSQVSVVSQRIPLTGCVSIKHGEWMMWQR